MLIKTVLIQIERFKVFIFGKVSIRKGLFQSSPVNFKTLSYAGLFLVSFW